MNKNKFYFKTNLFTYLTSPSIDSPVMPERHQEQHIKLCGLFPCGWSGLLKFCTCTPANQRIISLKKTSDNT